MAVLSSRDMSDVCAVSRIAEPNLSPVLKRMKTWTKERKRGRKGEVPPPVGEAKREECSRHPLLDHTTVVHKVYKSLSCRPLYFEEYSTLKPRRERSSIFALCFLGSQERKLQRRSVRSRSESERGSDPIPKKKTKKEQVSAVLTQPAVHNEKQHNNV